MPIPSSFLHLPQKRKEKERYDKNCSKVLLKIIQLCPI